MDYRGRRAHWQQLPLVRSGVTHVYRPQGRAGVLPSLHHSVSMTLLVAAALGFEIAA